MPVDIGVQLRRFWKMNRETNDAIKSAHADTKNWIDVYLMGLVEELGELMKVAQWKKHRKVPAADLKNIRYEIADVITYAVCLCQEYGVTEDDLVLDLLTKGLVIKSRFLREFLPPRSKRIIVTDLDGTVADFRKGFADWAGFQDTTKTLAMDLDNGIAFSRYEELKQRFEREGGYARLPAYDDAVCLLRNEQLKGTLVLVTTARPFGEFHRVEEDTQAWLSEYGIVPTSTIFGRDERIFALLGLAESNEIVLLEDDSTLALRAAQSGIKVMIRDQPYNEKVNHPNVRRYATFPSSISWSWVEEK